MELTAETGDLFASYLAPFRELTGDRRTGALREATVRGLVASESLVGARMAAFSPWAGHRSA